MSPMKTGFASTSGSEMVCHRIFLTRKENMLDILIKVDLNLKTKVSGLPIFTYLGGGLVPLHNAIPATEKACIRVSFSKICIVL